LNEATDPAILPHLHKMKARVKVVGDFADLKKIAEMLKGMKGNG
jgi:hypothetical protein